MPSPALKGRQGGGAAGGRPKTKTLQSLLFWAKYLRSYILHPRDARGKAGAGPVAMDPPPSSSCLQSGEVEEFLQLPVQRAVPWRRRLRAPGGAPEGVEHRAQGAVRLVQVL